MATRNFDISDESIRDLTEAIRSHGEEIDDILESMSEYRGYRQKIEELHNRINELKNEKATDLNKTFGLKKTYDEYVELVKVFDKIEEKQKEIANVKRQINNLQKKGDDNLNEKEKARLKSLTQKTIDYEEQVRELKKNFDGKNFTKEQQQQIRESVNSITDELQEAANSQTQMTQGMENYAKAVRQSRKEVRELKKDFTPLINFAKRGVKSVVKYWLDQDKAVSKLAGTFALTRDNVVSLRKHLLETSKTTTRLYGINAAELAKIQAGYAESTGRAFRLSEKQLVDASAMSRLMGENESIEYMSEMQNLGISTSDAAERIETIMNRANRMGVTSSKASQTLAKNLKLAESYAFKDGVDGLSRMVLLSEQMRTNMESITKLGETVSTAEGAIETAAKLQVLGGNFARYANPMAMMFEGQNDPEALQERIINMIRGRGYWDAKSGQSQIGGMDIMFLRRAAEAMGMASDEVIRMARTQIQREAANDQISKSVTDKEFRSLIQTIAQFNKQTGRFEVTDVHGNIHDVGSLTNQMANLFATPKSQEQSIHDIAQNTVGMEESIKNIEMYVKAILADLIDVPMSWSKDVLRDHIVGSRNKRSAIGGFVEDHPIASLAIGAIGATGIYAGRHWIKKKIGGGLADWAERREVIRRTRRIARRNGGSGGQVDPSISNPGGAARGARFLRGAKKFGKWGLAALALGGAIYGATKLFGGDDKEAGPVQVGMPQGVGNNGLSSVSSTQNRYYNSSHSQYATQYTAEPHPILEDQTRTLHDIRDSIRGLRSDLSHSNSLDRFSVNRGEKVSQIASLEPNIASIAVPDPTNGELGLGEEMAKTAGTALMGKTLIGGKAIGEASRNLASKAVGKIAGQRAAQMSLAMSTKAAAGPVGWIGLGVDALRMAGNATGVIEEGSVADKALGVGSWAATGAALGSVIPGIGTAIGGAIGGLYGLYAENKEKVNEWFSKTWDSVKTAGKGLWNAATTPFRVAASNINSNQGQIKLLNLIYRDVDYIADQFGYRENYPVAGVQQYEANFKDVKIDDSRFTLKGTTTSDKPSKIQLEVNGTLQLDAGKAGKINLNDIVKDPMFAQELTKIVASQINKINNGGRQNNNWNVPGSRNDINN